MKRKHNSSLTPLAKKLRKEMTKQEANLWYRFLRSYPVKFYRQKVLGPYIADFYCAKAKLVVELDGSQHFEETGLQKDCERTRFLENYGLTVLRIPNNEVDQNFQGVCELIEKAVAEALQNQRGKNMEAVLNREDILRIVKEAELPGKGWWLTSGAALVLYGVKERTRDVDLVCTTDLANQLEKQGVPFRRDGLDGTRIFALSGQIEVLENWHTDEVIELCGLPIASLRSIRRQKEALGREKDLLDIRLIDAFLEKNT